MASRSETAKLLASLELKDKFSQALRNADKALGRFDANLDRTSGRAHRAGQQIGTGIRNAGKLAAVGIGVVAANLALGLDSLIKVEKQTAQTEAVLKSTGSVAGLTAKDVRALAEEYEALNATVGDETIQEAANLLLGFTNVRKNAFEPALAVALDMNTRLGKGPEGLTTTIRTLGKALNDPAKGLGALSKVGITFNAEQTKRIKKLQEEGRLYEAQTVILDELNKRFGGAFAAEGGTTAGTVAKFTDAIEDTQRALATASLPAVRNIADALTDLVQDPEIQRGVEELGEAIGNMLSKDNIKQGAKIIGDVVKSVAAAAPTIAAGLSAAASVIGTVVSAFQKLPPEVQQLAVGALAVNKLTGGLLTNVAGGIFGALKSMHVQAAHVTVVGPGGGSPLGSVGGLGGGAAGVAGAAGLGAVAAVSIVGISAGAVGLLGIELGKIVDPTGSRTRAGAAETASARGVPDWNNKNLQQNKANGDAIENVSQALKDQRQEERQGRAATGSALSQLKANVQRVGERQKTAVDQTKQQVSTRVQETTRETTRGAAAVQASQRSAASTIAISQAMAASAIIAAIYAARPVISVTNFTRTYNNLTNYGPPGGDRAQGTGYGINPE